MENNGTANISQKLTNIINALFKAMAGAGIALIADVAALIIFAAYCAGTNMRETDPDGVLTGCVVFMIFTVALVICFVCLLLAAKKTLKKLRTAEQNESGGNISDKENAAE